MYTQLEQDIYNDKFDWSRLDEPDSSVVITEYVIRDLFKNLSMKFGTLDTKDHVQTANFTLNMDRFLKTLFSMDEYPYGFFIENRDLAGLLNVRALNKHNKWIDTHMDKDVYINIISSDTFHNYFLKCDDNTQNLYVTKIKQMCTEPYGLKDNSLSLAGSTAYTMLKKFSHEVFIDWNQYTLSKRAYLWCYALDAIQHDIQQYEILSFLKDNHKRDAFEELSVLLKSYVPKDEFNSFSAVTALYNQSPKELYEFLLNLNTIEFKETEHVPDMEFN